MVDASHIALDEYPLWHLKIVSLIIGIVERSDSFLDILADGGREISGAQADYFGFVAGACDLQVHDLGQHFLVPEDEVLLAWLYQVVVVVHAQEHEDDVRVVLVLIAVALRFRVTGVLEEQHLHGLPEDKWGILDHTFARFRNQPVLGIESFGQMMSPTFHTVLIVSHPEKAFNVSSTHVAVPHCQAVSDELELILMGVGAGDKGGGGALQVQAFEDAVLPGTEWTEVIFSYLCYLHTVHISTLFSFVDRHPGIFARNETFPVSFIGFHTVMAKGITAEPPNFTRIDKAKLYGRARPIVTQTFAVDVGPPVIFYIGV